MMAALDSVPSPVQRVLFVCTGNTCRSVFAEYIARDSFGGAVMSESAGFKPQSPADAEKAIYRLKKNFDIDAAHHIPRDIRSLDLAAYNLIIALEKGVARKLVQELGAPTSTVKLWNIRDPWGPDLSEYDTCSLEIRKRVLRLRDRNL
jgi:protein-tyrosine-phosphatase